MTDNLEDRKKRLKFPDRSLEMLKYFHISFSI